MILTTGGTAGLIEPSATLAMGAEAKRLKAQGLEVLDFALGEPDFDTPAEHPGGGTPGDPKSGQTHYTPPAGIPELRAGRRRPLHASSTACRPRWPRW